VIQIGERTFNQRLMIWLIDWDNYLSFCIYVAPKTFSAQIQFITFSQFINITSCLWFNNIY